MEESHKTHRPHIKVGKDEEKKKKKKVSDGLYHNTVSGGLYHNTVSGGLYHHSVWWLIS